ncbi:hypothetical protein NE865_03808 [Phthorimaea operculella]|nr:hypothetical protein NE865_03808 [Phthorimaea operculella]
MPPKPDNTKKNDDDYKMSYEDFGKLLKEKLTAMETRMMAKFKKDLKSAVEELKKEFTQTTDFLAAEQKDMYAKISQSEEHIKCLQTENHKLSKDLADIENRLRSMESVSRSYNVEVQALPENIHEDLLKIMSNICGILEVPLTGADIRGIRRVARMDSTDKRPRNVLVTLSSQLYRDKLITAFRSYNKAASEPLNTTQLNFTGERQNLYIVEHLSQDMKKLYAETRKIAKKQLSYSYVWVKYGRIYVRKSDDCAAILIKTHNDLTKLL